MLATTSILFFFAFLNRPVTIANHSMQRSFARSALERAVAAFSPPGADEYSGKLLGVSCTCELNRGGRYAKLVLYGIPIGGRLSGTAWFEADGKTVVLDADLEKSIARRMVRVYEAHHEPNHGTVTVLVSLPVLGLRKIVLHRSR